MGTTEAVGATPTEGSRRRWSARRGSALALQALVLLVPCAASLLVATILSRLITPPSGLALVGWFVLILGAATVTLLLVDRLARRFLPLVALLKLTLVFPDRAPSRLSVALRAGSLRRLRTWAE